MFLANFPAPDAPLPIPRLPHCSRRALRLPSLPVPLYLFVVYTNDVHLVSLLPCPVLIAFHPFFINGGTVSLFLFTLIHCPVRLSVQLVKRNFFRCLAETGTQADFYLLPLHFRNRNLADVIKSLSKNLSAAAFSRISGIKTANSSPPSAELRPCPGRISASSLQRR